MNPYVVGTMVVAAYNWLIDPTTPGAQDSELVKSKSKSKETK
jgi:uncharacterized membrane protein